MEENVNIVKINGQKLGYEIGKWVTVARDRVQWHGFAWVVLNIHVLIDLANQYLCSSLFTI